MTELAQPWPDLPPAIREAAEERVFEDETVLARTGEVPRWMYFVQAGEVRLARTARDGAPVTLQRVCAGWVAEASLFAPRYHCELVAARKTRCLRVPAKTLREGLGSPEFARAWIATLSQEVRRLRNVCERMSLRGAEARIRHAIECEGVQGVLHPGASLKAWAAELGLTHEALYRTLAQMESQGQLRREGGALELTARRSRPASRARG